MPELWEVPVIPGADCTCPQDENGSLSTFGGACPDHGHLAPKPSTIRQRWCPGSSDHCEPTTNRLGYCRVCNKIVPQKYGVAGVHLPDGSTPRE